MSEPLHRVVVVLNPNSTGDGPSNARELQEQLAATDPALRVELVETQHAGHAEEIARDAVTAEAGTLVVSASGDGGYHEVVNGVVAAGRGMAAVLASGNANDHATATQTRPLAEAIHAFAAGGPETRIDLLEVSGAGRTRVAHSYVGVGITPVAAAALNEHHLDAVKEALLVAKAFWGFRPMTIAHEGRRIKLDSLVFANIDRMAKYAQISDDSAPDDGRFETLLIPHRGKLRLVLEFLRVVSGRHESRSRSTPYEFQTQSPMPLQMDGEVFHVDSGSTVTVRCLPRALRTVG
ncbi:diacylglycerol kinase family enzyme [Kineococcus radiotolerans]|uniref:Diacylglycerol kinase catalytic region n=2 Tax=Kineococcus radiotolerans TaxID=131568 RepID=A6W4U0_KINRD|nr:diacylglycerol kinase family protein [Kineococcus radiotolerans]ABS01829.1 diacylglycerol kinase catalytic region [Kineococcus radiotolerans SRS30216 = ATCC BAA-149]MBB2901032.1 diacylglycerol kinase family enzyme [Kineococcus radiotolerans]